jgi:enoyl-CoA hydratase
VGTLQRIQHVMPSGLARELAYSSRNLGAEEALACGFVNKVYETQEEMLVAVRALATDIARHSPMAVHGTKKMLNFSRDHSVQDSLNYMATWQSGMLQVPDVQEAMQAGAEKRTPKFENLLP